MMICRCVLSIVNETKEYIDCKLFLSANAIYVTIRVGKQENERTSPDCGVIHVKFEIFSNYRNMESGFLLAVL